MIDFGFLPVFILLGSFYVFAGIVAGRAVLSEAVLDAALSGISGKRRDPLDVERAAWLLAGACVVSLSGILLATASNLALPTFLLSCALQATHFFILSPQRFDVQEPVPPEGRQQSLNAFMLYLIVTCFVIWATFSGHLVSIFGYSAVLVGILALLWLCTCIWAFIWFLTLDDRSHAHPFAGYDEDISPELKAANAHWAKNARLILAPSRQEYPLFEPDTGEVAARDHVLDLELPDDVLAELRAFSALCGQAIDPDDPREGRLLDPSFLPRIQAAGLAVFARLQLHLGDRITYEPAMRANLPRAFPARVDLASWPHSSCVFEGWPDPDNLYGLWPQDLGLSQKLVRDLENWAYEAADFSEQSALLPNGPDFIPVPPGAYAAHIVVGRALAVRLAEELAATDRADVAVAFHER